MCLQHSLSLSRALAHYSPLSLQLNALALAHVLARPFRLRPNARSPPPLRPAGSDTNDRGLRMYAHGKS